MDPKEELLEMMQEFEGVDATQMPSFFFLKCLQEELSGNYIHRDMQEAVLAGMKTNLPGLGLDYKPHEQWLRDMAKSYSVIIKKIIDSYSVFGFKTVEAQLRNLSLVVE